MRHYNIGVRDFRQGVVTAAGHAGLHLRRAGWVGRVVGATRRCIIILCACVMCVCVRTIWPAHDSVKKPTNNTLGTNTTSVFVAPLPYGPLTRATPKQ